MMKILTFAFFISFLEQTVTEEHNKIYKCGVGEYKIEPPAFGIEILIINKNPLYRRRPQDLDNVGFKIFNIYLRFRKS